MEVNEERAYIMVRCHKPVIVSTVIGQQTWTRVCRVLGQSVDYCSSQFDGQHEETLEVVWRSPRGLLGSLPSSQGDNSHIRLEGKRKTARSVANVPLMTAG